MAMSRSTRKPVLTLGLLLMLKLNCKRVPFAYMVFRFASTVDTLLASHIPGAFKAFLATRKNLELDSLLRRYHWEEIGRSY